MHYMRDAESPDDPNVVVWEVGYFEPTDDGDESWHPLRRFRFEEHAARYVNYLNGGDGENFVEPDDD